MCCCCLVVLLCHKLLILSCLFLEGCLAFGWVCKVPFSNSFSFAHPVGLQSGHLYSFPKLLLDPRRQLDPLPYAICLLTHSIVVQCLGHVFYYWHWPVMWQAVEASSQSCDSHVTIMLQSCDSHLTMHHRRSCVKSCLLLTLSVYSDEMLPPYFPEIYVNSSDFLNYNQTVSVCVYACMRAHNDHTQSHTHAHTRAHTHTHAHTHGCMSPRSPLHSRWHCSSLSRPTQLDWNQPAL